MQEYLGYFNISRWDFSRRGDVSALVLTNGRSWFQRVGCLVAVRIRRTMMSCCCNVSQVGELFPGSDDEFVARCLGPVKECDQIMVVRWVDD